MKVINFHGAPCSGKSVAAADLFSTMKKNGFLVELVIERSKELIYEGNDFGLRNEIGIFAEKHKRIMRHVGKVDYVITDSPLLNSVYYGKAIGNHFVKFVEKENQKFENIFFTLHRRFPYDPNGRNPDEKEGVTAFEFIDQAVLRSKQPAFIATGMSSDDIYRKHFKKGFI